MTEMDGRTTGAFLGNIPQDNLRSTLSNYAPEQNSFPEDGLLGLALANALVEAEPGTPAGLLLTGEPGNGKTHLAVGIGRAIAERGGKAVFLTLGQYGLDLKNIPHPSGDTTMGWQYDQEELVATHDVLIFDDVPGNMAPGSKLSMQNLVMGAYRQGKRVVITSNRPAPEVIRQLTEPVGSTSTTNADMSAALRERFAQTYALVEFRGESFRSGQRKWSSGVELPKDAPTMAQAVLAAEQLTSQRREQDLLQAIGEVMLVWAESAGISTVMRQKLERALNLRSVAEPPE